MILANGNEDADSTEKTPQEWLFCVTPVRSTWKQGSASFSSPLEAIHVDW